MASVTVSCFVHDHPRSHMHAWNWLLALKACGQPEEITPIIRSRAGFSDGIEQMFRSAGASLMSAEDAGDGPAGSALSQLDLPDEHSGAPLVVTSADALFLESPQELFEGNHVRACPADALPVAIASALLEQAASQGFCPAAGTREPAKAIQSLCCQEQLYVVPADAREILREEWARWAAFCAGPGAEALGGTMTSEAAGFALAMLKLGLPFSPLAETEVENTHPSTPAPSVGSPAVLLCGDRLDNHGLPQMPGAEGHGQHIDCAISRLRAQRRNWFSNEIFWNFRYRFYPELGSGIGSRGDWLEKKRALLLPFAEKFAEKQVLDVGCGDLETSRTLPFRHYTGLDSSHQALEIARQKRPDWSFRIGVASDEASDCADLVICLDVLIHVPTEGRYREFLGHLVRISRQALLVSGYARSEDAPPGGIVFFHEALSETFSRFSEVAEVQKAGRYSGVDLLYVTLHEQAAP